MDSGCSPHLSVASLKKRGKIVGFLVEAARCRTYKNTGHSVKLELQINNEFFLVYVYAPCNITSNYSLFIWNSNLMGILYLLWEP